MIRDKYKANEVISYDFRKGSLADQTSTNDITSVTDSYFEKSPARSLFCNGSSSLSASNANVGLTGNQSMTVTALIVNKNNGNGNNKRIFRLGNTSANAFFSGTVNDDGTVLLDNWGGNLATTDALENGKIYHLTFKYDGTNRYIYINGSLSNSGAYSALSLTDAKIYLGSKSAGSDAWKGNIQVITVYNTAISDEDIAKIAEEELTSKPYNIVDYKSNGNYRNFLPDGDCEEAGVGRWEARNSATITKVTGGVAGQALRVAYNGSNSPGAMQAVFQVGKTYRLRGYAKGDGVFDPKIYTGAGAAIKTNFGTITDWTYFDIIWTADNTKAAWSSSATSAGYAEWDELEIFECELDGTPKYTEAYIADGKGWNETIAPIAADGYVTNTGWYRELGNIDVNAYDGFNKDFTCNAGPMALVLPSYQAYGTWEFDFYKGAEGNSSRVGFIAEIPGDYATAGQNGYYFTLTSVESVRLILSTNGSASILSESSTGYLSNNTWYKIKITRDRSNKFTMYYSTDDGKNYTLIDASVTGSNPVTNSVHTECKMVSTYMATSDKLRNFKFIPYIQ